MKKNLALVCFSLITIGIFAQSSNKTSFEKSQTLEQNSFRITKSVTEVEQILDSTITVIFNFESGKWENRYRETFAYDTLGNTLLYMRDKWTIEENRWIYLEKKIQEFNNQNLLSDYEQCYWQDDEAYWKGENKHNIEYDENGYVIKYLSWQWKDDTREWKYRYYSLKDYDERGNTLMENTRLWDEDAQQWIGGVSVCKRTDSQYDENNNEIQVIYYQWDADLSGWVSNMKDEHAYDASGKEIVYSSYLWDSEIGNWTKRYKQETTYDSLGNPVLDMRYYPDSLGNWLHVQKTENTYAYFEDTVLVTLFERLNWEPDSSRWNCVTREITEVDGNGYSLHRAYFDYMVDGDSLRLYQKFEWDYDQWGNMISEIRFRGFSSSGELQPSMKLVYEFDPDGNQTMRASFHWDGALNKWEGRDMETFAYNGAKTTTISYEWEESLSGWVETDKEIRIEESDGYFQYYHFGKENPSDQWQGDYGYEAIVDEHRNMTGDLEYAWDTISNDWYIYHKTEYEFDYTCMLNQILLPDNYSYMDYSHKIESSSEYEWDTVANELTLSNVKTFYYSPLPGESSINTAFENFVKVYPNPANDFITVGLNSPSLLFEVFDLKGERRIRKKLLGTGSVNISNLQPGLYLYTAKTDKKTVTGKFIVKH